MVKALLDTSTYVDMRRMPNHRRAPWAQNTLQNATAYGAHHERFTISSFTAFEILEGIYRDSGSEAADRFVATILPNYEVIYPDAEITFLAADIHASLARSRQSIGVVDTFIAATAITGDLTLVNANTRHFPRIVAAGFALRLENWRELPA